MISKFNNLCKVILEDIKSSKLQKKSKKHLIKEDIDFDQYEVLDANQDRIKAALDKYIKSGSIDQFVIDHAFDDIDDLYSNYLYDDLVDNEQILQKLHDGTLSDQELYQYVSGWADNYFENVEYDDDALFSQMYDWKQSLFNDTFVDIAKRDLDKFKTALLPILCDNEWEIMASIDQDAVTDPNWWTKNGLPIKPEELQELNNFNQFSSDVYDHCFAADDYCDWDYPEDLIRHLDLNEWIEYIRALNDYESDCYDTEIYEKYHPEDKKYKQMVEDYNNK